MSGYRQSGFDPNSVESAGPPLRPFDKWQWLGFALGSAALLLLLADIAGRIGALPSAVKTPQDAILLLAVSGTLLVNYRRRTLPADLLPDSSPARRRLIAVVMAIVGLALTVFLILSSPGA